MKAGMWYLAALGAVLFAPVQAADRLQGPAEGADSPPASYGAPGSAYRRAPAGRPSGNMDARGDERFRRADADGSGLLSLQEAERGMPGIARNFDRFDANRDGQLSRDELQAVFRRQEERRAQCRENPEQCRQQRQARTDERFNKSDNDGDGMLTREEAGRGMPGIARRFDTLDANRDGQLSRDEMQTGNRAQRAPAARPAPARPYS